MGGLGQENAEVPHIVQDSNRMMADDGHETVTLVMVFCHPASGQEKGGEPRFPAGPQPLPRYFPYKL